MGPIGGLLHSEYVASDMDEIRKALGADQISYLGFSYGSTLGVWYATLFPESVRAMVVDGADNPVDAATTQQERVDEQIEEVAPLAASLQQALAACDDPRCPIYNDGDPVGYFKQAVAKLDLVNAAMDNHPLAGVFGVISTLYSEQALAWPVAWSVRAQRERRPVYSDQVRQDSAWRGTQRCELHSTRQLSGRLGPASGVGPHNSTGRPP